MNLRDIISTAASSLAPAGYDFDYEALTEEEAREWLAQIVAGEVYLSVYYSERRDIWVPCLRP
jgi:hypothetical protein